MRIVVLRARLLWVVLLSVIFIGGLLLMGNAAQVVQTAAAEEKRPIYSVETQEKKVSLGINCAWDAEDIPVLIDLLAEHQVTATFFVVGEWCDKFPDAVRAIDAAGHEIGTHSDTHADMAALDREGIVRELRDSAAKIEALTGKRPTLFRPPSGSYNTLVIATAEQEGFYPIQWDCERMHMKT